MDDEEFDDLLAGVDLLEDLSQESLTTAAANLEFSSRDMLWDYNEGFSPLLVNQAYGHDMDHSLLSISCESPAEAIAISSPKNLAIVLNDKTPSSSFEDAAMVDGTATRSTVGHRASESAMAKIEAIFTKFASDLLAERSELCVTLKTRTRSIATNATPTTGAGPDRTTVTSKSRSICFPGKTAEEAWRFTVIVRILELIHEALRKDTVLSKRDIYYRDPALFGSQTHVDRYIDDIALTFDVPRSMLNVTAVSHGLVAGALEVCRRDGSTINVSNDREGMLVPSLREVLSADMKAVRWILVVEKEASFRSIAASSFWDKTSKEGVLITGKGYPDIATRAFLHFLATPSPRNDYAAPQIFGLVDFDPDGLAIFSVYKHGSVALSHENGALRVPQLRWLGLRSDQVDLTVGNVHASQGLLSLSLRDRKKAVKMIEGDKLSEDGHDSDGVCQALQTMLMLNMKAELQLLDATPGRLVELLKSKLHR